MPQRIGVQKLILELSCFHHPGTKIRLPGFLQTLGQDKLREKLAADKRETTHVRTRRWLPPLQSLSLTFSVLPVSAMHSAGSVTCACTRHAINKVVLRLISNRVWGKNAEVHLGKMNQWCSPRNMEVHITLCSIFREPLSAMKNM